MENLKMARLFTTALLVVAAGVVLARASDRTAIYALVDKVVLEPGPDKPEAIQIWGVFSIARPNWNARTYKPGDDYFPAARGYLYFKAGDNKSTAGNEWADLQRMAGTRQIVSFGSRFELQAKLRKTNEPPKDPDPYVVNIGVTKVRGNTEYAPVRTLLDYRD